MGVRDVASECSGSHSPVAMLKMQLAPWAPAWGTGLHGEAQGSPLQAPRESTWRNSRIQAKGTFASQLNKQRLLRRVGRG